MMDSNYGVTMNYPRLSRTTMIMSIANRAWAVVRDKHLTKESSVSVTNNLVALMAINVSAINHPAVISKLESLVSKDAGLTSTTKDQILLFKVLSEVLYMASLDLGMLYEVNPNEVMEVIFSTTYDEGDILAFLPKHIRIAQEATWVLSHVDLALMGSATNGSPQHYGGPTPWTQPH